MSAISVLYLCFGYEITIPACRHNLVFSSILNDPCPSTVFHKIPKSNRLPSLELNEHLPSFLFFPFVVVAVVFAGCILPIFFIGEMRRFPFIYSLDNKCRKQTEKTDEKQYSFYSYFFLSCEQLGRLPSVDCRPPCLHMHEAKKINGEAIDKSITL